MGAAFLAGALLLYGCAREVPRPLPAAADTVRGVLERVGSEPATWLVVRASRDVRLVDGPPWLGTLTGTEVMVRGAPVPDGFRVDDVRVRAVDGEPAMDGVLAREGAGWVLTHDGRRLPVRLPAGLHAREGTRVWFVGQPPERFGVITEAP